MANYITLDLKKLTTEERNYVWRLANKITSPTTSSEIAISELDTNKEFVVSDVSLRKLHTCERGTECKCIDSCFKWKDDFTTEENLNVWKRNLAFAVELCAPTDCFWGAYYFKNGRLVFEMSHNDEFVIKHKDKAFPVFVLKNEITIPRN